MRLRIYLILTAAVVIASALATWWEGPSPFG